MDVGATMVTHLFNAMPAFAHREPGVIGLLGTAAERKGDLYFGIIADGIHSHSATVKLAYSAHPDGLVLVTDAMPAMGLPPGESPWADGEEAPAPRLPERTRRAAGGRGLLMSGKPCNS